MTRPVATAAIKIVDARGRTIQIFERWPASEATPQCPALPERWVALLKPPSRRGQKRIDAELDEHGFSMGSPFRSTPLIYEGEQPIRLELPGLTLRWQRATQAFDELTSSGIAEVSIDQLRRCVQL
ncbi:hypothetical protein MPRG_18350 [Mycobacterium paragordonae]|uniref:Uncharacterized protein n=1 Tax=Mycobacterium paragordonae TaxID=1389713 RepID=A0ABQ1C2B1_9MYCO|nr:hypothetical protein MPRG_18350 [Mycobacterium paragordonae]